MACFLCELEFERRDALDGESCPHCRLVGDYGFTGQNAATDQLWVRGRGRG